MRLLLGFEDLMEEDSAGRRMPAVMIRTIVVPGVLNLPPNSRNSNNVPVQFEDAPIEA
jgi:hypothetical protein